MFGFKEDVKKLLWERSLMAPRYDKWKTFKLDNLSALRPWVLSSQKLSFRLRIVCGAIFTKIIAFHSFLRAG